MGVGYSDEVCGCGDVEDVVSDPPDQPSEPEVLEHPDDLALTGALEIVKSP